MSSMCIWPWSIRRSEKWIARLNCSSLPCATITVGLDVPVCRCSRISARIPATPSTSAASVTRTRSGRPLSSSYETRQTPAPARLSRLTRQITVKGSVMNRAGLCRRTAAVGIACLIWTSGYAQSERVTLRMAPQPNQTIRVRTVQENEVEVSFEAAVPEAAPSNPMKLTTKTIFGMTQKFGAATKEGNIEAEIVYDEISSEATMNGQVMPSNSIARSFIDKKLVVTFDKQGNVLDVKVPPDLGVPQEAFKQMLESMYRNLPALSIGVGE